MIDADIAIDAERGIIESARARLKEAGSSIALAPFAELIEIGKAYDEWVPLPPHPQGRDALSLLMYISGSNGTPKCA